MRKGSGLWGAAFAGVLIVMALSGCGRRGDPLPPPGVVAPTASPVVDPTTDDADRGENARKTAPKKKFFLDFLL